MQTAMRCCFTCYLKLALFWIWGHRNMTWKGVPFDHNSTQHRTLFWISFGFWNHVVTTGGMSGRVCVCIRVKCELPIQTVRDFQYMNVFYKQKWCFQSLINYCPEESVMHGVYISSQCTLKGQPSCSVWTCCSFPRFVLVVPDQTTGQ